MGLLSSAKKRAHNPTLTPARRARNRKRAPRRVIDKIMGKRTVDTKTNM